MAWGTTPTPPASGAGNNITQIQNPAKLRQCGHRSMELGGELHTKGHSAKDETAGAAAALKGASWDGDLGRAMDKTTETWGDQVESLVRTMREIHAKCTATADNYEQTEHENETAFRVVPQSPTPFG
ncbi:WXG100 family type VII secretion target [Streptomyces halobius]|uniref:WXG100 family type VII secretion target n=1 Tax=Streptomyces halobius TaxID=2879846 RepID=A0ABY4MEQ8_9ACTN|nr:WXG100 family type VII secretion target [Streptomyces halobius]UQA95593.1 WXG100 family type VII secretion target [Streptomyces halobius]